MPITGRQIVTKALQKARILTKNETPAADEINDGLSDLIALVSSWANDTLLAFVRSKESFPILAAVGSYTIGDGGDFDTVRPTHIVSAFVRIGSTDYPITTILDASYDTNIGQKAVQGIPDTLLYEPGNPLGTITLYPVPSEAATLHIRSEKPLTALTLNAEVDLPPGWERALIYNLAVEVAPDYGVDVTDDTKRIAVQSKDLIKLNTARNRDWSTPPLTGSGGFNVLTGSYT